MWAPQGTQAGHGVGKGARATGEGGEHSGACQGARAKYPKKLLEGAAGQIWGTSSPLGAPRVLRVGLGSPHLPAPRAPQGEAECDAGWWRAVFPCRLREQ